MDQFLVVGTALTLGWRIAGESERVMLARQKNERLVSAVLREGAGDAAATGHAFAEGRRRNWWDLDFLCCTCVWPKPVKSGLLQQPRSNGNILKLTYVEMIVTAG